MEDTAIYQALTEGWIAGVGRDDLEEEPAKLRDRRPRNPLLRLPNVIVTPHAAYYSEEVITTVRRIAPEEASRAGPDRTTGVFPGQRRDGQFPSAGWPAPPRIGPDHA
ncbi:NAD(P)-dependent oxidoreductase [Microtetraspora glauca]|uniref:NAD(P)-dependent oxidoreductase n=1 Tax=Microtetraspora glauca TaxID=1996 RepID=A0ABV3GK87_MICGL